MKPLLTLMFRSLLLGPVLLAALATMPATAQDRSERLGGPVRKELQEQYTPEQYREFLRREQAGEISGSGSIVPSSPGTTDVLVNNNGGSTGTGNFTQSETSILAFGNTVVIGFNDAGSFVGGANKFTGWSYSTDGGSTFTDGGTLPTNAIGDAGDPVLARDETTGMIYFSTLGFSSPSNIQMWRSTDNGVSWLPPVNATPGGSSEDKQWHTVDNFPGAGQGNVYMISRRFGSTGGGPGIYMFRSTDQGATFGPTNGTLIVAGSQGAFVAVGPDHSVYAFWFAGTTIQMRKSTDFGVTFGAPVTVASALVGGTNGDLGLTGVRQGTTTASGFRSNEFPHAAVNPVSGHLYVTYNNDGPGADKADVLLVQSTDGGATWGPPQLVNDDLTPTDQWQPTIAVTPDGSTLGVFYYSREDDPATNNLFRYYGRQAVISGSTLVFTPSVAISDVASLPEFGRDNVVNSTYMGDYNHVAATAGYFHVVWSDNRDDLAGGVGRKDPNVYYEKIPAGLLAGPNISVTPTTINFGGTIVGQTAGPVQVFLTNTGDTTLTITSITAPSPDFSASIPPTPFDIASTTTVSFPVSFTPAGVGVQNGSLLISSTALNDPAVTVNLSGRGFIPDANDLCANAIAISCGTSVNGNTDNATLDTAPICGGLPVTAPGLWYTIVGTGAPITLSTCSAASYDTRISVYTGSCGALTCVTANDDFCGIRSQVTFASTDGVTYYVLVHGAGSQTGTFTLEVSACPAIVSVTPPVLDITLPPNATTTVPLDISNVAAAGALDLLWSATALAPFTTSPLAAAVSSAAYVTEEPLFQVSDVTLRGLGNLEASPAFRTAVRNLQGGPALDKTDFLDLLASLPEAPADARAVNAVLELAAVPLSEIKDVPGAIGGRAAATPHSGPSSPQGSGGPDGFGYRWIDSNEPGGPVFAWEDIVATGTPILESDDASVLLPIGFTFPFYGASHETVRVSTNGYLTFGTSGTAFTNAAIPTAAAPNDLIAPFWDDLNPAASGSGTVFYRATGTEFIVQYQAVYRFGTTQPVTFQVILRPGGEILYQYLDMQGTLNSATVGIENPAGTDGLQVAFNAAYVENNLAVRLGFQEPCDWITSLTPTSGTVPPAGTQTVQVAVDAAGLASGSTYTCEIRVLSNAANDSYLTIPVNLTVSDATAPPVVNAPIIAGAASVSGTSTEPDATVIILYVNGDSTGTTAVSSGLWTVSGLAALAAGDSVQATATAPGELTSPLSNLVIVSGVTAPPVVSSPITAGATSVSGTSSEADGTSVEVFVNSASVGTTTVSGGAWTRSGLAALVAGDSVKAIATASGKVPSAFSNVVIVSPAGGGVNVVANPGFETGRSPWQFFTNGAGTFTTVSPGAGGSFAARVAITTPGTNTQLYQSGIVLQAATQYRLTFKALSSTGRNLAVHLTRHDSPYTNYGLNGVVFDLTSSWQTFSVDFTTINFPPPSPSNARLRFRLNGFAVAGEQYFIDDVVLEALPGGGPVATQILVETAPNGTGSPVPAQTVDPGDTIFVYAIARDASNNFVGNIPATWSLINITDGVDGGDLVPSGDARSAMFIGNGAGSAQIQAASGVLTPVPSGIITVPTPPPAANLVVNGGFEAGTANWTFQTNGTGAFSSVVPGNVGLRAGQVNITAPGTVVQLYQRDITLTSGTSYRLSFKARCNTGHDLSVSVFKHTSPFTPYGLPSTVINLTSSWAEYVVNFDAGGFGGTVSDARLRFWLAPYDAAGDVYEFDDVRLEVVPAAAGGRRTETAAAPTEFSLGANFPNPFNPSTTIIYVLPVDAEVTLEVYDVLGRRVAQLADGLKPAGYHDAVFDAGELSSGIYIYRMTATGVDGRQFSQVQKMLLTK